MSYTVKKLEKSQVELTITVSPKDYEKHLEKAAQILASQVSSLEVSTQKMSDFQHIQQGLERSFASLEKTAQLENVLVGIKDNLSQLQPVLKQLNQPRRITLIEHDNGKNPE